MPQAGWRCRVKQLTGPSDHLEGHAVCPAWHYTIRPCMDSGSNVTATPECLFDRH